VKRTFPPPNLGACHDTDVHELLAAGLSPLVGREVELEALRRALGEARLVTLIGPGGVGKTRLALAALEGWRGDTVAVELAAVTEPDRVPGSVLAAAGVRQETGVDPAQTLADRLAGSERILLLDNCEQVRETVAALCGRLLTAAPQLRVLATSRIPIGVPGEQAFELAPLSLGPEGDAVRLFLDRAGRASRAFTADNEVRAQVEKLCAELDGLPLAIELAAARTRVLDVRRIALDLERRLDMLGGGSAGQPRHRSLRASMDWSYELLSERERLLFERLSVFSGGWDLSAAEAVCATAPGTRGEVLDLLTSLVDQAVVVVDRSADGTRFGMLSTVRAYAQERLAASGAADGQRGAHAAWCAELVEGTERQLMGAGQAAALAMLDREAGNVRAALAWARGADHALGLRIGAGSALYWHARGRFAEGRDALEDLLRDGRLVAPELRARALWGLGLMLVSGGEPARARAIVEEAVGRSRDTGEPGLEARALNLLGQLDLIADPVAAQATLHEAAVLARRAGDAWCLADALGKLGAAALYRSEAAEAKAPLEEALEIARRVGNEGAIHRGLGGLARVAAIEGDAERAIVLLREGLALSQRLGDRSWIALDLAMLGELERFAGRPAEGKVFAERGLALAEEIGAGYAQYFATGVRGRIALALGDLDAATGWFAAAVELSERGGLRPFEAWWRLGLADVALARGNLDAATANSQAALASAEKIGNRRDAARATSLLGLVALGRSEHDVAIAQLTDALAVHRAVGDRAAGDRALAALVRAFAASGQPERAERLRSALARAEGGREEAAALALRGRGARSGAREPSWGGLTRAEAEVAEAAATGASNPEIADRLFMSRSTVKTHLSRVYAKLGIANRTELAAAVTALRESKNPSGPR
jgi:predicted ATPase/DNA-binding NarL/FixJ family response regulator